MEPIDYFKYIHLYNKFAKRGWYEQLKCSYCKNLVSIGILNDSPRKICYVCNSNIAFTNIELNEIKKKAEKIIND